MKVIRAEGCHNILVLRCFIRDSQVHFAIVRKFGKSMGLIMKSIPNVANLRHFSNCNRLASIVGTDFRGIQL